MKKEYENNKRIAEKLKPIKRTNIAAYSIVRIRMFLIQETCKVKLLERYRKIIIVKLNKNNSFEYLQK